MPFCTTVFPLSSQWFHFTFLIPVFTFPTVALVELWLIHGSWFQNLLLGGIHLRCLSCSRSYPWLTLQHPPPLSESPSAQVLGHLTLSVRYIHIVGFVFPDFPLNKSLTLSGPQFPFCQGSGWGLLVSKNLSHSYDWMFVLACWDTAFHISYPRHFCRLRSWGGIRFRFHPTPQEGRKWCFMK